MIINQIKQDKSFSNGSFLFLLPGFLVSFFYILYILSFIIKASKQGALQLFFFSSFDSEINIILLRPYFMFKHNRQNIVGDLGGVNNIVLIR